MKAGDVDFAGLKGASQAERGVSMSHEPGEISVTKTPCTGVGLGLEGAFREDVGFLGGDPEFAWLEVLKLDLHTPGVWPVE